MVWVKICGVRDAETARRVAAYGPDAIGLNFYPRSSRCVSRAVAAAIVEELPSGVQAVGVFVNATALEIAETVAFCGLTSVQLHGDEPSSLLAELQQKLPGVPLIRAWRLGAGGWPPLTQHLTECANLDVSLFALLLDASVPGEYGGTGAVLPWAGVRREAAGLALPPLILAGGLTPANVGTAIETVNPWGVDVASGVETSPGVKDFEAVRGFISESRVVRGTPPIPPLAGGAKEKTSHRDI
jgi:phosphoribosylanthranilate isomerase